MKKAKQNSARKKAKCSKCFQFLCNNSDRTWFFNALTFARSLGRCWKPRPLASVFNTSHGTWRMLMHEKPCLIPITKFGTMTVKNIQWSVSINECCRSHQGSNLWPPDHQIGCTYDLATETGPCIDLHDLQRYLIWPNSVNASRRHSVRCTSNWWSGGCGFSPSWVQQHSFMMKYFLRSFSPFCWFKNGSCSFLVKKCAQFLVKCLED